MKSATRSLRGWARRSAEGILGLGAMGAFCAMMPSLARANPADLFGLGAREAAMGNAFTAVADDPFAAYYNLGGLVQAERTVVSLGLQLGHTSLGDPSLCPEVDGVGCSEPFYYTEAGELTLQQKRYGYEQPHGLVLGLVTPLSKRLRLGVAAYLPVDVRYSEDGQLEGVNVRLIRFQTSDPYVPDYILYQSMPQRFAMYSGLAYEVTKGLGVGLGATMLATADVEMNLKAVVSVAPDPSDPEGSSTTTTYINPQLTMGVKTVMTPLLGVYLEPGMIFPSLSEWRVGLAYRGESKMTTHADISADVALSAEMSEGEEPFTYGMTVSGIGADVIGLFTPRQLALGVSGHLGERWLLAVDGTFVNWRAYIPSMTQLPEEVQAVLGVALDVQNAREVDVSQFRNTVVPRVGAEWRVGSLPLSGRFKGMDVYLRAGGAYERNPFGAQLAETNLLNSDRILGTGGAGVTTHNPFSRGEALPVSLDVSIQYHYLLPTEYVKDTSAGSWPEDGYPVDGSVTSSGSVLQGAMTLQVAF